MRPLPTPYFYAGLVALTVAAYLPVWHNGFVDFDDEVYITANPRVMQGLTPSGFCWAWRTFHGKYWQPLSWLSLQLDAQLFTTESPDGQPVLSPAAFHAQSLFWHGASALLLFALWQRLTGAAWRSFLVAAVFAVHPMHVESVAWAAERKDVLSVFFGLLTLWAYARYVDKPGWWRYLGVGVVFLLSLLCKPMLMTLPFVLLLLDYWPLRRLSPAASPGAGTEPNPVPVSWRRLVLEKVPLFALATASGVVTVVARTQTGAAVSLSVLPLSARVANALSAYGWYLSHTACPLHLAVLYPHPMTNWSLLSALAGAGTLLALTFLALWQAGRRRWFLVGWLWFVGTLVPVIGLTQGGEQAWADRFSYWPHIGLFVVVAWGLGELVERLRIPAGVCGTLGALVLGCLAVLTWSQVSYWRDTAALWEHALAVTDNNPRAHVNLGTYYQDRGRFDEARRHFAEAVRLQPDAAIYHHFLGAALLSLGEEEEAAEQFQVALQTAPTYSESWYNLGVARLRQGDPEAAVLCCRKVLELEPGAADALALMGQALWRAGERPEAVQALQAALERDPKSADAWLGLGRVYLAQGQVQGAIEALRQAVRFNSALVNAHNELGVALSRDGQWAEAAACHRTAVDLQEAGEEALEKMHGRAPAPESIPQIVLFRCRLAFALGSLGQGDEAGAVSRAAFTRDPRWPEEFTARAWKLATDPDANRRDPRLAYELVNQAMQAVDAPTAPMLDALAAAQAGLGQSPEAVRTAQQALDRAEKAKDTPRAEAIRARLRLYQQGKAVVGRGS